MTDASSSHGASALLEPLIGLSRHYGADPDMVLAGGGNTSAKDETTLWVKASGFALEAIDREGFVPLDRAKLLSLMQVPLPDSSEACDRLQNQCIADAKVDPDDARRPSVECVLHALLPGRFVVHTHPVLANILGCCTRGREIAAELMGERLLWMDYVDPGLPLARAMHDHVENYRRRHGELPTMVLVQNHGLFIGADEPDVIHELTWKLMDAIATRLAAEGEQAPFGPVSVSASATAEAVSETLGPVLARQLAEVGEADREMAGQGSGQWHICFDDSEPVRALVCGERGREMALLGPLMPDQVVYAGSFPLWLDASVCEGGHGYRSALEDYVHEALRSYLDANGLPPRIVLAAGLGMFAAGRSAAESRTAGAIYQQAMRVMAGAAKLGGIHPMTEAQRSFIEQWEAEAYRQSQAEKAGRTSGGPASYRPSREWMSSEP